jgi:hypothetical protein
LRTSGIICLVIGGVLLLAGILGLVLGKKPAAVVAGPAYPTGSPTHAPPGYPVQPYPPQQPPGQPYPPQQYPPQQYPPQQYPPQREPDQPYPPQQYPPER